MKPCFSRASLLPAREELHAMRAEMIAGAFPYMKG
jgi:hypothetical protein